MADLKISQLTAITVLTPATDVLPVVDSGGVTKKITTNQILGSGGAASFSSASVSGTATIGTANITGAATVGGSLNVSGATNFTNSVVFTNAVTLGDAVGDAVTATGSFTSHNGQAPSAIRAAASDYAAVTFDGATASTRIASACQAIGTGDFSLWSRFRVPTATPSNQPVIIALSDSGSSAGTDSAYMSFENADLRFTKFGASSSDARRATISGVVTAYSGQVVDIVVTRTGTTLKIYINGTDTAYTETTAGTPPAWSSSVNSSFVVVGARSSTTIFSGRIYRSVVFNRALSASDVTELITTGVNPADQWGTQTAVLNATFTGTTDSFTATGAGVSVASVANQLEVTSTTPTGGGTLRNSIIVPAKNYRIAFKVRLQSGDCTGLVRGSGALFNPIGATTNLNFTPTAVLTQYLYEFNNVSDTSLYLRLSNTINPTVVELDDVVLERIGAIVDLDFTVGAGYQATDRSTNALHGTLFNGVEFTQPRQMAVLYATTSFNGDTLVLGSNLSIPTNAIIEDIICNSSGTATVSIGTAPAGTTIVNAASVVAGRQKLTIGTPFSSNGTLYVKSNSAAVLQFTILYTVAA